MMRITYRSACRRFFLGTALLAVFGFITQAPAQAQERSYLIDLNSKTLTKLESWNGGSVNAKAINDSGQVVGEADGHAFITGPDGLGMRDLGTLGGASSSASGINDEGRVVGYSYTSSGMRHAFITGPDGNGMRDLGTLGGGDSRAYGINEAGQVVGDSSKFTSTNPSNLTLAYRAFITDPDGASMKDLGTLGGDSSATGINDAGRVVGHSMASADPWRSPVHPFITGPNGTGMSDLGTLDRVWDYNAVGVAIGINDLGQVVGWSTRSPESGFHAFITGPDGAGMRDLGTLGGSYSRAFGVNDVGQVVGESSILGGFTHAFITDPDGVGMSNLNSLVDLPPDVFLTSAVDINNVGQVIAVVVPEPEIYVMLLVGLCLIGFVGRPKNIRCGVSLAHHLPRSVDI